jgi:hypothetical protein
MLRASSRNVVGGSVGFVRAIVLALVALDR